MSALATRATRTGRQAFVSGDFNVAHRQEDLRNWKGNLTSAGFLPQERAHIDRWLARGRWTDLGRAAAGEGPGPYTWWSWRGKAFDNDAGWRIDYALATRGLAARMRSVRVARAASYDTRWSDHAAVAVTFS
jgi:exodeoxyribonuclease-3